VGTWDNQDQVYGVAALTLVTGQLTRRWLEQPARSKAKTGHSKQQRLQGAFAAPLRDIARMYPASTYPEVVITIDNAPWHRGAAVEETLAAYPHLRLSRLPSYSPQLNVIERFWRVLRRRATHKRLFASMARVRATLRNNISDFQTMRQKVLSLIDSPRKTKKEAKSDTPGKAGGLMSGTASKAVGYCERAKNALLRRRFPAPEYRPELVPAQSPPSRPPTRGPRNAPPQSCDLVQQTAGRWE
jgi:transposase